jgi:hypothetical protein
MSRRIRYDAPNPEKVVSVGVGVVIDFTDVQHMQRDQIGALFEGIGCVLSVQALAQERAGQEAREEPDTEEVRG